MAKTFDHNLCDWKHTSTLLQGPKSTPIHHQILLSIDDVLLEGILVKFCFMSEPADVTNCKGQTVD